MKNVWRFRVFVVVTVVAGTVINVARQASFVGSRIGTGIPTVVASYQDEDGGGLEPDPNTALVVKEEVQNSSLREFEQGKVPVALQTKENSVDAPSKASEKVETKPPREIPKPDAPVEVAGDSPLAIARILKKMSSASEKELVEDIEHVMRPTSRYSPVNTLPIEPEDLEPFGDAGLLRRVLSPAPAEPAKFAFVIAAVGNAHAVKAMPGICSILRTHSPYPVIVMGALLDDGVVSMIRTIGAQVVMMEWSGKKPDFLYKTQNPHGKRTGKVLAGRKLHTYRLFKVYAWALAPFAEHVMLLDTDVMFKWGVDDVVRRMLEDRTEFFAMWHAREWCRTTNIVFLRPSLRRLRRLVMRAHVGNADPLCSDDDQMLISAEYLAPGKLGYLENESLSVFVSPREMHFQAERNGLLEFYDDKLVHRWRGWMPPVCHNLFYKALRSDLLVDDDFKCVPEEPNCTSKLNQLLRERAPPTAELNSAEGADPSSSVYRNPMSEADRKLVASKLAPFARSSDVDTLNQDLLDATVNSHMHHAKYTFPVGEDTAKSDALYREFGDEALLSPLKKTISATKKDAGRTPFAFVTIALDDSQAFRAVETACSIKRVMPWSVVWVLLTANVAADAVNLIRDAGARTLEFEPWDDGVPPFVHPLGPFRSRQTPGLEALLVFGLEAAQLDFGMFVSAGSKFKEDIQTHVTSIIARRPEFVGADDLASLQRCSRSDLFFFRASIRVLRRLALRAYTANASPDLCPKQEWDLVTLFAAAFLPKGAEKLYPRFFDFALKVHHVFIRADQRPMDVSEIMARGASHALTQSGC